MTLRAIGILGSLVGAMTGCMAVQVQTFQGTCSAEYDACLERCDAMASTVQEWRCDAHCAEKARECTRRQGDRAGLDVDRLDGRSDPTEYREVVSFVGEHIAAGEGTATTTGPVAPANGVHAVGPGGLVKMSLPLRVLPSHGELILLHGARGAGTFVTVTLDGRPLVGRYAPPPPHADGRLRIERWDLAPVIELMQARRGEGDTSKDAIEIVVYNNREAGSAGDYLIGAVQLVYRERR
jgi:hypothetical protein